MGPSELVLDRNEARTLSLVVAFLAKQRLLVDALQAKLGGAADLLTLRSVAPRKIVASDDSWDLAVHGIGVRFTNTRTNEVVDVHVGVWDAPDAFDAWRLEQYAESIQVGPEELGPMLQRLAARGVVSPHEILAKHYELSNP